ncbi:hypothetical protein SHKM778_26150 [Streptomyces sp. KM77-8]|uniref:Uncharacterized protein n=1 Tax=Streptomyces haneummycinicus TaxID=3074435 RepID=A0AAT9HFT7_9ACTN
MVTAGGVGDRDLEERRVEETDVTELAVQPRRPPRPSEVVTTVTGEASSAMASRNCWALTRGACWEVGVDVMVALLGSRQR